ncbi:MAG: hypothetical protein HON43_03680 [Alphaproteobacteria bacterium]|nr:hypothetical protein [Alphaproteobacteria bacterium]MBT5390229.1 hypothetical protein [Alphaproteobacteria bacterium]
MSGYTFDYPPYVPVAERKKAAARLVAKLKKKGQKINPIVIEGRAIAKTFWGRSWCGNLNSYSDYENRMPRGRQYARNGSVIDLNVNAGEITALVSGSEIYKVQITISSVTKEKWKKIVKQCSGKIGSLIELLQGKFSKEVMEIITQPKTGLFPEKNEIKFDCSCFDYADMCKHVSAVLYGVGARLDGKPEDLFLLRQADHTELIESAGYISKLTQGSGTGELEGNISELFGVDIVESPKKKKKSKPK